GHQQRVTDSDAVGSSGDVARRIRRGVQLEAELATGRGRPAGDLLAEAGGAVQQAHATNVAVLEGNGPQHLVEIRGGWSKDVQHVTEGWATQPRRGSTVVPDHPPCGLQGGDGWASPVGPEEDVWVPGDCLSHGRGSRGVSVDHLEVDA